MILGSSALGDPPSLGDSYTVSAESYNLDVLVLKPFNSDFDIELSILKKDITESFDIGVNILSSYARTFNLDATVLKYDIGQSLNIDALLTKDVLISCDFDSLIGKTESLSIDLDTILCKHHRYPVSFDTLVKKYNIRTGLVCTVKIVGSPTIHRTKKLINVGLSSQERAR